MAQRGYSEHRHLFYEAQTGSQVALAIPLVPAAAQVDDRFLLGLAHESALQSVLHSSQPVLRISRELSQLLFPDAHTATLTHTLTIYDRLSSALTVAQVAGVQRLCDHYAARLNPLPGPDSSRESNNRLTQLTQYVRQLAMQPSLIDAAALRALDAVGLTEPDIVTLSQLAGFVSYQARMVAGLQALMAQPLRWQPYTAPAADASPAGFDKKAVWRHGITPLELRYASADQLAAITFCQPDPDLAEAVWVLAHDPATLYSWQALYQQVKTPPFSSLAAATSARLLGSCWAFQRSGGNDYPSLLEAADSAAQQNSTQEMVIRLSAQLTRAPERFSAVHLQPLIAEGWQPNDLFKLIQAIALSNWSSRIFFALGETADSGGCN